MPNPVQTKKSIKTDREKFFQTQIPAFSTNSHLSPRKSSFFLFFSLTECGRTSGYRWDFFLQLVTQGRNYLQQPAIKNDRGVVLGYLFI